LSRLWSIDANVSHPGIVSALAFSPSYESELFAAGSLTPMPGNIALFNESQGATPVMFVEGGPEGGAAVTQVSKYLFLPQYLGILVLEPNN